METSEDHKRKNRRGAFRGLAFDSAPVCWALIGSLVLLARLHVAAVRLQVEVLLAAHAELALHDHAVGQAEGPVDVPVVLKPADPGVEGLRVRPLAARWGGAGVRTREPPHAPRRRARSAVRGGTRS